MLPQVAAIVVAVGVGVALADLLVAFDAVDRIAALSRPLTGPANLPDEVGGTVLTTAASTTAGYGMLAEYRDSGLLDDRATLVAVTINTFCGFVQHIFTFYAPILVPILGLQVGLLYVGVRAGIALAITATGVVAGAVLLGPGNVDPEAAADVRADGGDDGESATTREKLLDAARTGLAKSRDILPRLAVVYTLVAALTAYYDVEALTGGAADPLATLTGLPAAAVPVVVVYAVDTTSGAVTVAPLIDDGVFTARTAVATMLVGGIVSFTVSTFKRSIPFQFGVWGGGVRRQGRRRQHGAEGGLDRRRAGRPASSLTCTRPKQLVKRSDGSTYEWVSCDVDISHRQVRTGVSRASRNIFERQVMRFRKRRDCPSTGRVLSV